MTSFDAIVIGGGHNGLVAAATLAKSGRKVLVLEAASEVGGVARTEEFAPGFRVSSAHLLNRLHPDVVKTLELEKHGLVLSSAAASGYTPTPSPSPQGGGELGVGSIQRETTTVLAESATKCPPPPCGEGLGVGVLQLHQASHSHATATR